MLGVKLLIQLVEVSLEFMDFGWTIPGHEFHRNSVLAINFNNSSLYDDVGYRSYNDSGPASPPLYEIQA
jgi:hypothetical protein